MTYLPSLRNGLSVLTFFLSGLSFAGTFHNDSLPVAHVHDGNTAEWRPEQFSADAETSIRYAFDNDATDLYIALEIPNTATQIKMMRMGMNIYFDLKGKKKEGRGIGFPVKPEGETQMGGGGGFGGRGGERDNNESGTTGERRPDGQSGERRGPDMTRLRMMFATHLMTMHLFGFSDEPVDQGLERENSAQIAFSWDSSNVWHIEYKIPLSLFGEVATLDQHLMTVGFKLNGMDVSSSPSGSFSGGGGGFGGRGGGGGFGGRGGGGGRGGNGGGGQENFQNMMKEQLFWTKYTFSLPQPGQKAF